LQTALAFESLSASNIRKRAAMAGNSGDSSRLLREPTAAQIGKW
jgi:hypothetical protein